MHDLFHYFHNPPKYFILIGCDHAFGNNTTPTFLKCSKLRLVSSGINSSNQGLVAQTPIKLGPGFDVH